MTYDLMAVTNHYGSLSFGHYTAYAKSVETGIWYDYNDSSVTRVSTTQATESDIVSGAAYVLYYLRRDFFPSHQIDFEAIKCQLPEELQHAITEGKPEPAFATEATP